MTDHYTPADPAKVAERHAGGPRRIVATLLLSAGLLAVGGTAVVLAADPVTTPAPATSTAPSDDPATAPSSGGTTSPEALPGTRGPHGDCPAEDGSGAGSAPGTTTPSDPTTPESSADPADV